MSDSPAAVELVGQQHSDDNHHSHNGSSNSHSDQKPKETVIEIHQEKDKEKDHEVTPNGYLDFLARLHQQWNDCPDVHLQWQNLSHILQIPVTEKGIRNFFQTGLDGLKGLNPLRRKKTKTFHALAPSSGCITPGTMTLVLCPPGHGKSTFLRALAGRMDGDKNLGGQVLYNGLSRKEALDRGVYVSRLLAYVAQGDLHFPVLTTKETLQFAAQNSVADLSLLTKDKSLLSQENLRSELLISLLGLDECKDTIIGNDLLRGVSGGQRRRVTLGEMLITNARVMLLDEVSTGLDAAVTYHIFNTLKQWCQLCRGSIVTALLQPTPEVYELFDDVILLRDGETVYHGPRAGVKDLFANYFGMPIPADAEESGFVVDYLTDPRMLLTSMKHIEARKAAALKSPSVNESGKQPASRLDDNESKSSSLLTVTSSASVSKRKKPKRNKITANQEVNAKFSALEAKMAATTREMLERYKTSPYYVQMQDRVNASLAECKAENGPSGNNGKLAAVVPSSHNISSDENDVKSASHSNNNNNHNTTHHQAKPKASTRLDPTGWCEYTKQQFAQPYPHSFGHYIHLDMIRQMKLTFRNKQIFVPRLIQAVLMGLIFSTLYFQLSTSDYQSRFGLTLYCVMFGAFANLSELPLAAEARSVVTKQVDAGFYPSIPFILSNAVWAIPRILVESFLFGLLMYWVPNFQPDAGNFFFFIFILTLSSMSLSTFFRTMSFVAPNPDVARQLDFPFIIIFVIFGGFLLPYDKVPNWLIWVYWINPLQWGMTALSLNEFLSDRYSALVLQSDGSYITQGVSYLNTFSIRTDRVYQYAAIAFLLGFFAIFVITSALALQSVRATSALGTKRLGGDKESKENKDGTGTGGKKRKGKTPKHGDIPAQASSVHMSPLGNATPKDSAEAVNNEISVSSALNVSAMPFTPVTLAWRNINYTVMVKPLDGGPEKPRKLLNNISGFAKPGTMTALMGSSGAGKTTLMDVVAFRKTMGIIEGQILVNGLEVGDGAGKMDKFTFNRLTGYVEQQDLHMGLVTIREALDFSAQIRLPSSVAAEDRRRWVEEVMHLVGLTRIGGRLIGDAATPGLSPGQLKLLTIGVELVANPSIIFLDEPTSGLDAPSAARVMKAIKRIADTGRSIVCTIHQPSSDIFFSFDRLLLLRSGGEEVFFSDIGEHGSHLVDYFESVSAGKAPRLPFGQNPANWMLDIIGAGVASAEGGSIQAAGFSYQDYTSIWRDHRLHKDALSELEILSVPTPASQELANNAKSQPSLGQMRRFLLILHRYFVMHWRNAPTNLTRIMLLSIIGLLLGVIYFHISATDYQGVQSLLSVVFLGLAFPSGMTANSAFPSFFRQRAVYYRESTIGMYDYKLFSAALFVLELPYVFFSLIFFIFPFYFMVGLANDGTLFFKYYTVVFLMATTYSSISQLWMALAPSVIASNVLNSFFMSMFFMFGGVFIRPDSIPQGWKWFYYIDPIGKSLIAATTPQFYCDTSSPGCPTMTVPNNPTPLYISDYVSDSVGGNANDYSKWIGWLILTIAVLRILILIALKKISHLKR